jgi:AcrR family transcriptional regulator
MDPRDNPVKPRRRYDASRRQEKARLTRRRILAAARCLFVAHGYAGTTMKMIAAEAEVALATVELLFRTKVSVLKEMVDVAIAGDDAPIPIAERPAAEAARAERDQQRILELQAHFVRDLTERFAPIHEVVRNAVPADPEIAALWQQMQANRMVGARQLAALIASRGPLRAGVHEETAADIIWTLHDPTFFLDLVTERGWTAEQYEQWLSHLLRSSLLP